MGSSAKKKKEKKADFVKPKLKVGKARPKNTNATDTSFSAKSIVLKQQSLSEGTRDANSLFVHNLSLLGSRNDTQRRDALAFLTTAIAASPSGTLPKPASEILAKVQPLILDGSASVRSQVLKLLRLVPSTQLGNLEQILLYTRAGMTHLSNDIRIATLDVLDWLIETNGEATVSLAGGWIKTLQTFQNLLSWHLSTTTNQAATNGSWSAAKTKTNLGSNKLLVHQLNSLALFLTAGLSQPLSDPNAAAKRAAEIFPLVDFDAHDLPRKSNPFGSLNLFGAPRDVEGEMYQTAEERVRIFEEMKIREGFAMGVKEAKREGGEVGRAASAVEKALRLVEGG